MLVPVDTSVWAPQPACIHSQWLQLPPEPTAVSSLKTLPLGQTHLTETGSAAKGRHKKSISLYDLDTRLRLRLQKKKKISLKAHIYDKHLCGWAFNLHNAGASTETTQIETFWKCLSRWIRRRLHHRYRLDNTAGFSPERRHWAVAASRGASWEHCAPPSISSPCWRRTQRLQRKNKIKPNFYWAITNTCMVQNVLFKDWYDFKKKRIISIYLLL